MANLPEALPPYKGEDQWKPLFPPTKEQVIICSILHQLSKERERQILQTALELMRNK